MRIPSYDDLTPSIPDVAPGEVFASVGRLLRGPTPVEPAAPPVATEVRADVAHLFACLRSTRNPDALLAIARDFSPRIERHGAGCVVLDVAGLEGLLGAPSRIGAELDRAGAAHGGIRVAVAPTQASAMLLSIAHSSLTVVTGHLESALSDIPLRCLEQLLADVHGQAVLRPRRGAGVPQTASGWPSWVACAPLVDVLRRWGLQTLGELAALPSGDLSARLGQEAVALQRLARGSDPRPLVADPTVPRFVGSMELEWPIDTLEPLSFVLARLLDPLSSALERADRAAAAIRLDLRLTDRTAHTRALLLPAPLRDARVLRTLLSLDLESHPPHAAIDVVAIEIDPAPGRVIQYSLLDRALPSVETLATLTARLGALVGDAQCGSPVLLDTRRPDGFEIRRFAPVERGVRSLTRASRTAPAGTTDAGTQAGSAVAAESAASGIASESPESTHALEPCVRRFRPPLAIRVVVERGAPVHVAIDRRGMPGGAVEQCAGPWRTSGEWWNGSAGGWNHDEWEVALSDGSVCRLFRERETGRWFLDGVLD